MHFVQEVWYIFLKFRFCWIAVLSEPPLCRPQIWVYVNHRNLRRPQAERNTQNWVCARRVLILDCWRILELGRPIGLCSSNTEQAKVQFFIISHMLATLLHWINALRLLKSKEYQATSTHCNYCARLSLHWALSTVIWILHWALNPSLSTLSIIWILNPTFQRSAALRQ